MDYYKPTKLFRNNALRKSVSFTDSCLETPPPSPQNMPRSQSAKSIKCYNSWMLDDDSTNLEVVNKPSPMTNLNIKSNYFKIPDNNYYLTSMSIQNSSTDSRNPLLAISSGESNSNLFIYDLDINDNFLTHHNTITLPNIFNMKWLNSSQNLLVTGNRKSFTHLVLIPDVDSEDPAEIIKRFNHSKHLAGHMGRDLTCFENNISKIELTNSNWLNEDNLVSLYKDYIFKWDLTKSRKPILIRKFNNIVDFELSIIKDDLVATCGAKGIQLYDLKIKSSSSNEFFGKSSDSHLIKWCPQDPNILASGHTNGIARLWDIRNTASSFAELAPDTSMVDITSIEWSNSGNIDLFSGYDNGNIIHWDLSTSTIGNSFNGKNDGGFIATATTTDTHQEYKCVLKEGFNSIKFNPLQDSSENLSNIISERQCGTLIPASNNSIINLTSLTLSNSENKILSIDKSSFLGIHSSSHETRQPEYITYNDFNFEEEIAPLRRKSVYNTEIARSSISSETTLRNDSSMSDIGLESTTKNFLQSAPMIYSKLELSLDKPFVSKENNYLDLFGSDDYTEEIECTYSSTESSPVSLITSCLEQEEISTPNNKDFESLMNNNIDERTIEENKYLENEILKKLRISGHDLDIGYSQSVSEIVI